MVSAAAAPPARRRRARGWWRAAILLAVLAAVIFLWSRGGGLFGRQYEYEEDLVLALDGSASLTINASVAALVALRGLDLDPTAPVDRARVGAAYASCPGVTVERVPRPWTRGGRQFVQIRLAVEDVRRASECAPLGWSRYELTAENGEAVFRQTVGESAFRPGTLQSVGWRGGEIVAFRVHFPARILDHNSRTLEGDVPADIRRGNILAWEQYLTDRLDGRPVRIVVRMENRSILFLTLWLFAAAFTAAILTLAGVIWWAMRRGRPDEENRDVPPAR